MKRKTWIGLTFLLIVLMIWGGRVYSVNAGVAKKYAIDSFELGESVILDDAEFQVVQIQYGEVLNEEGYESLPVTVTMNIKNTSDQFIPVLRLIESKLAYGMDYYQTMTGTFDADQLRNLPPNETAEILLVYFVNPKYKGQKARLYIDQSLYSQKVIDKYKNSKRYGMYVNL